MRFITGKILLAGSLFFIAIFFCGCPQKITVSCDKVAISCDKNSTDCDKNIANSYIASIKPQISDKFIANFSQLLEDNTELSDFCDKTYSEKIPEEFVSTKKVANGKTQLAIKISPELVQKFLDGQNNEKLRTIVEGSLAPVVSGEEMSEAEYRNLLGELYGADNANEILSGDIQVDFVSPDKKITSKKIRVAELLLSTKPVTLEFDY